MLLLSREEFLAAKEEIAKRKLGQDVFPEEVQSTVELFSGDPDLPDSELLVSVPGMRLKFNGPWRFAASHGSQGTVIKSGIAGWCRMNIPDLGVTVKEPLGSGFVVSDRHLVAGSILSMGNTVIDLRGTKHETITD